MSALFLLNDSFLVLNVYKGKKTLNNRLIRFYIRVIRQISMFFKLEYIRLNQDEDFFICYIIMKKLEEGIVTRTELGERIKEIRMMRNLTRDQLAGKSGLSSKFLYEVENGRKGLSVDSLIKIANALSCSCDQIIMGKEVEEKRYDKIMNILSKLEEQDVEYVVEVLASMKNRK